MRKFIITALFIVSLVLSLYLTACRANNTIMDTDEQNLETASQNTESMVNSTTNDNYLDTAVNNTEEATTRIVNQEITEEDNIIKTTSQEPDGQETLRRADAKQSISADYEFTNQGEADVRMLTGVFNFTLPSGWHCSPVINEYEESPWPEYPFVVNIDKNENMHISLTYRTGTYSEDIAQMYRSSYVDVTDFDYVINGVSCQAFTGKWINEQEESICSTLIFYPLEDIGYFWISIDNDTNPSVILNDEDAEKIIKSIQLG